jgi:beta-lactamase class A
MKKVTAFSLLFSLGSMPLYFFFANTSKSSASTSDYPVHEGFTTEVAAKVPSIDFTTLPLDVPDETMIRPLESLQDQDLQQKLEEILTSDSRWVALAKNKKFSIGIVDMQDPLNSRFAAINPNNMVYAASLPKIAILLASEDAIASGKLAETPEVKQDMRLMIAKSSNEAASRMFNRVGIANISSVLQDPCYNLYDKQNGGGLWVGKPYGSGGTRVGDPIKGLSHAASVLQVCKYYYMLAFGQLVNEDRSKDMLDMLVDPQLHHKFVSVLDKVAPGAKVYRKSGTWENWHADSVLVWDKNRRYIVVALAEDGGGETMLRELMLKIDNTLALKG